MTEPTPAAQPAPAQAMPSAAAPAAAVREPLGTDTESVVVAGVGAVLAFVAAIVNFVSSFGFPYNAPIEWIWSTGITIDLVAAGTLLTVRFFLLRRRPRVPGLPLARVTGWAATAAALAGVCLVGWLALGGGGFIVHLATGHPLRYYVDVNGFFLLGLIWVAGVFFAHVAYRRGRSALNNRLAVAAGAVFALLVVPTLASGILYGLGLTD